ncbi:antirepressor [Sphingobium sp. TomMM35A]
MNDIIPFSFENQPVRIDDRNGEPWFVLADLCRILELSNPSKAAAGLDDDERDTLTNTEGMAAPQVQQMTVINESGLYKLILRSRKPAAKRFTKWLTSIVLPTIRRTGSYGAPAPALDLSDPATLQNLLIDLTGKTLDASERIAKLEPKAEALDRLTDARGAMCMTDAAKVLGVPPRRLVAWMEANKWVYRRADAGSLVAFGNRLDAKVLEHKGTTIQRRGHPDKWVQQVMVTPKGLARLAELKAGA